MKLQNVFRRKKSSSSPRYEPASGASFSSGPSLPLSKSDQHQTSQVPGAYAGSPSSSAHESGASSDKSSEYSSEYQELAEVFGFFDSNGDGKISSSELGSVLKLLGDNPTEEELRLMLNEADFDGDGFIDLSEFIKLHKISKGDAAKVEELKSAFRVFDADKNGLISAEELHGVLINLVDKRLTLEECCRMIKRVDRDGDGSVNFDEFERMMTNNL